MPQYVLGHDLKGEGARLALMSELLDPMHRRYIDALGVAKPRARTLEVGCGNGSISAWLAERVSPGGTAVAVDLDLSLVDRFLVYCADSNWWTQTIAFTAAHGFAPGGLSCRAGCDFASIE